MQRFRGAAGSAVIAALWMSAGMGWAQTPAKGSAAGTLVVGEKTIALTHAYAQAEDDVEGTRLDGPAKSLVLLLTDAAVAPDDVTDFFKLAARAHTGELHGIAFYLDPATKNLFGVTVYCDDPPGGKASPPHYTLSGTGLNQHLRGLSLTGTEVSGTAETDKPEEWPQMEETSKPKSFHYQIAFHAAVRPPLPVTATLTGKAAKASPQVAVTIAYFHPVA